MSIFKELSPQDVYYGEYFAYKQWTFDETDILPLGFGIQVVHTRVNTGSFYYPFPQFEPTASSGYSVRNYYNSIKQLYYHKDARIDFAPLNLYTQASSGSFYSNRFYAPDHNFGPNGYRTYKNLADSSNTNFAAGSSSAVVISIPQQYIGDRIKPGSVHVEDETEGFTLYDDKWGNLYDNADSASFSSNPNGYHRGNVFYEHGVIVITSQSGSYQNFGTGSNTIVVKYKSTQKIHELEAYCVTKEGEFNYSWNPSFRSGSSLNTTQVRDFVTGSSFSTYPTTIGLYDNHGDLVAIGKFAQPIRNEEDLALTFVVRLDW